MMFLILTLVIIIFVLGYIVSFARQNYGKLTGLGFPVIQPTFMMGSVPKIHQEVQHMEDINRFKKYGPVWGMYQGRVPIVYLADPDLIRQIFVKDSTHFFDREPFDFGHPVVNEILDYLPGSKWKTMRVAQTRLFSSGKIKQYSNDVFLECMTDFLKTLEADLDSQVDGKLKIDTRSRFCTFTIDAIARSMLSMKVEASSRFYNACKKLIGEGQEISPYYIWTLIFPILAKFEPTWVLDEAMTETFKDLLAMRKKNGQRFDDFADVLNDSMDKLSSAEYQKLGITETTLMGQTVNFFLAGFDRISTSMTFMAYHLALDEEIQTRLLEEIDEVLEIKHGGKVGYDTFADMPYLNACISETFRLYPIFFRPERVCNKDWECSEKGIKIPKGVNVMIASWAANRNPDMYENPDDFYPERFMPENKANLNPYAFSTFGFGHRNCIGTRFAYEAMKVSMSTILRKFKFEKRPDTVVKFKPGVIMILQYDPVFLNVVRRNIVRKV